MQAESEAKRMIKQVIPLATLRPNQSMRSEEDDQRSNQREVCSGDPAREFNSPATAININLLLDSDSVSLAISATATISAAVTRPVNLIRRRRQSNQFAVG